MIDYKQVAKDNAIQRQRTKEYRAELLKTAMAEGVGIVHIFNADTARGGLTIAFRACSPYPSGVMVDVAVSTCSEQDAFSRTIGTTNALEQFFGGMTVSLPLLKTYAKESITTAVKTAFTNLYYSV